MDPKALPGCNEKRDYLGAEPLHIMARLESLPCYGCQPAPALEAEDCQAEDLGSWLTFLLGSRCLTSALGYEMEEEGICLPA